jgi:hypothetical protein
MTPAEIFETNIANRLADPTASAKAREIEDRKKGLKA